MHWRQPAACLHCWSGSWMLDMTGPLTWNHARVLRPAPQGSDVMMPADFPRLERLILFLAGRLSKAGRL